MKKRFTWYLVASRRKCWRTPDGWETCWTPICDTSPAAAVRRVRYICQAKCTGAWKRLHVQPGRCEFPEYCYPIFHPLP